MNAIRNPRALSVTAPLILAIAALSGCRTPEAASPGEPQRFYQLQLT